jgi:hypothetical protein
MALKPLAVPLLLLLLVVDMIGGCTPPATCPALLDGAAPATALKPLTKTLLKGASPATALKPLAVTLLLLVLFGAVAGGSTPPVTCPALLGGAAPATAPKPLAVTLLLLWPKDVAPATASKPLAVTLLVLLPKGAATATALKPLAVPLLQVALLIWLEATRGL